MRACVLLPALEMNKIIQEERVIPDFAPSTLARTDHIHTLVEEHMAATHSGHCILCLCGVPYWCKPAHPRHPLLSQPCIFAFVACRQCTTYLSADTTLLALSNSETGTPQEELEKAGEKPEGGIPAEEHVEGEPEPAEGAEEETIETAGGAEEVCVVFSGCCASDFQCLCRHTLVSPSD